MAIIKKYLIPVLLLLLILLININIPFNRDLLGSFGAAFQADHLGDFPANVYSSWNMRGIGYKYFIYGVYKVIALFCEKNNDRLFQILAHIIYYITFISLSLIFFKISSKLLEKYSIKWYDTALVFLLSMLASSNHIIMQADETAIFLCIGMIAFAVSDNKYLNLSSGIFITLLLMSKLISVVLVSYAFFILIFLQKSYKIQIKYFIASCLFFTLLTILFYILIIPQEIIDTIHATQFQASFKFEIGMIPKFFRRLAEYFFFSSPFCIIGMISFLVVLFKIRVKKYYLFLFLILVFPIILIFVQRNMFQYHYVVFILFSVFNVLLVKKIHNYKISDTVFYNVIFIMTFSLWFVFTNAYIEWPENNFLKSTRYSNNYNKIKKNILYATHKYGLPDESEILFLSDGTPNYFIYSKSYLRHFIPLPLQRIKKTKKLIDSSLYKDELQRVLNYSGKYIYLQPEWFVIDLHPKIKQKISSEYIKVFSSNMGMDVHKSDHFIIYQRKS